MSKVKPLVFVLFVSIVILLGTILVLTDGLSGSVPNASIPSETAVIDDIVQREYHVTWQPKTVLESVSAAYHAPNRSQNLRSYFTPEGVYVVPRQAETSDWQWGLHLTAYGSNTKRMPVAAAKLQANGNRIEYQRGEITEWYVNDTRGLEQGFTIQSPPLETAVLHLDMAVSGTLTPAMLEAGQAILFLDEAGAPVLRYSDLYAFDARQKDLPARMDLVTLKDGRQAIRLTVDAAGAAYPLTIDPVTSSPAWTASIAQSARFGTAVSGAGDVNGDGYDDVIVGASWYDNGQVDEGAAFLYLGSASGLGTSPSWMVEGNTAQAEMGNAVSSAGDVNRDGYDDVIVGAHRYGSEQGAAYVYLGGPFGPSSTADWSTVETLGNSNLGYAVGRAGDVNRDGYDEVIIGAPNYGATNGRVYVYYGDASGLQEPPWIADGDDPGMRFGGAVNGAGDVNNDTFDDIIIGSPEYLVDQGFAPGLAVVFHGGSSGLPDRGRPSLATEADWFQPGQLHGMLFGFDVSTAGDVNNDGFDDVIIGAPDYDAGEVAGHAAVYYGGSNGLIEGTANWSMDGGPGSFFGTSVNAAGDVDRDGVDDVIVGAPNEDDIDCPAGQADEGKAFLYPGQVLVGLDTVALVTVGECQVGSRFGRDVAGAGDVNGDGYDDFVVGAPEFVTVGGWRGQAFGYYGSGILSGLTATNDSPKAVNAAVTFNAQLQEGGYALYDWAFGDGQTGTGASTTHAYAMPGVYTATVIATNEYGSLTSTTNVTITTNALIDPQNGGSLSFTDSQGRGTTVNVPPGAVNGPVSLNYTPLEMISQPKPPGTIDYYFDLDVANPMMVYLPLIMNSSAGNAAVETAVSSPDSEESIAGIACAPGDFCFLQPISVTITYNESLLTQPEDTLLLMFWDEELQDWFDAATTCAPTSTYQRDLANNQFTVAVCHLTRFGVIGAN